MSPGRISGIAALLLGIPGFSQAQDGVLPVTPAPAAAYATCPSADTNSPSAWQSRCELQNRGGGLRDGGKQFIASIGATGGHDSAFNARKNLPAVFEGAILYGRLNAPNPWGLDLFENIATAVDYHTPDRTIEYLNSTYVSISRSPSTRDNITFDVNNVFGNDSIRIMQLGGTDASAETASYGTHAGRTLNNQATFRFLRQSTETRWWAASLHNNFRDFIDDHSRANTVHERAEVHYQPSERAGIGLFQEISAQTGEVDCQALTGGVIYERRLGRTVSIEGSAGPSFGTKGCTSRISANLYGALSVQPSHTSNIWVSGFRRVNDSDFAAISFESNVQSGLTQQFGREGWFSARGGWLGGTTASEQNPYHGAFASTTFGHTLWAGLILSVSAQHFRWGGMSTISPTRTITFGTLLWAPRRSELNQANSPRAR